MKSKNQRAADEAGKKLFTFLHFASILLTEVKSFDDIELWTIHEFSERVIDECDYYSEDGVRITGVRYKSPQL